MSSPWYPPPPAPPRPRTPRWAIATIAAIAALLVVAGVFAALTLLGAGSARAVTREPVNTAGSNPFMGSVGTDEEQVTTLAHTGGSFRGDTPGLYGGTRDNRTCDPSKLTSFLDSHPGQAAAWAGVLGIRVSDIDGYVATLTPVLLRSDTWVTNHGYSDGHATAVSSVLQAGSAVFVNHYGAPVVRCACGNPLSSPTVLTSPVYVGPIWASFDQTNITIVQNTTVVIDDYTLVDPRRGDSFRRPPGDGPDQPVTGPTTSAPPTILAAPPGTVTFTCPAGGTTRPDATAVGDLTGDGRPETVGLLTCGGTQQVQVVDATGSVLDTLPAPETPPGSPRAAEFDPSSFGLSGTTLTTGMKVYGADDTSTPTLTQTWTWTWDGGAFTLAPGSVTPVPAATTTEPPTTTTEPPTTTTTTTEETIEPTPQPTATYTPQHPRRHWWRSNLPPIPHF